MIVYDQWWWWGCWWQVMIFVGAAGVHPPLPSSQCCLQEGSHPQQSMLPGRRPWLILQASRQTQFIWGFGLFQILKSMFSVAGDAGDVRGCGDLLPPPDVLHPPHLRARLLRVADRGPVVEPVHAPPLAGHHGHPRHQDRPWITASVPQKSVTAAFINNSKSWASGFNLLMSAPLFIAILWTLG